jgi:PPOX class probable F420-dependent enzyme
MTQAEREAFLADVHVGVIAIERPDGPPLAVPVWYSYEPGGEVTVLMDGDSVKGRLIERAGRISLCAQQETAPYRYVSVEGPVTVDASDLERDSRPMAHRYLGVKNGDRYTDASGHGGNPIRVRMTPQRWFSVDYAKARG